MILHATGTFEVTSWDEEPIEDPEGGPRLTCVRVRQTFRGDLEGEGRADLLTCYRDDENAVFVGLQRVVGRVGGWEGSFVVRIHEELEDGFASAEWVVVPGSGTGDLRGLSGRGGFSRHRGGKVIAYDLDLAFEDES